MLKLQGLWPSGVSQDCVCLLRALLLQGGPFCIYHENPTNHLKVKTHKNILNLFRKRHWFLMDDFCKLSGIIRKRSLEKQVELLTLLILLSTVLPWYFVVALPCAAANDTATRQKAINAEVNKSTGK